MYTINIEHSVQNIMTEYIRMETSVEVTLILLVLHWFLPFFSSCNFIIVYGSIFGKRLLHKEALKVLHVATTSKCDIKVHI